MTRIIIPLPYQILGKMCGGVLWIPKKEANVTETIREEEEQEGQVTPDGSPEFCSKLQMVIYQKLTMPLGGIFDQSNLFYNIFVGGNLPTISVQLFINSDIKLFRRFFLKVP